MTSTFPLAARRPVAYQAPPGSRRKGTRSTIWIEGFILFQFACQLALLSSSIGPLRGVLRTGAFGFSLLMLVIVPGRGKPHPASKAARWIWFIVGISLLHPSTNSWTSGLAEVALYVAILGPLFWVSRLHLDAAGLRRVFLILWGFHTLSAGIGVLQVCYPGKFQPSLSTAISRQGKNYVNDLYIKNAQGERVFRPMGLTDVPGGAATAGFYAALFGISLMLTEKRPAMRGLYMASLVIGLICLYLSQVRVTLVMLGICVGALCCVLLWRGDRTKLIVMTVVLPTLVGLSFLFAVAIGGKTVTRRLGTLVQDEPTRVYYKNRGHYLDYTAKKMLPEYPLGAGLGRWGMVYQYFGDKTAFARRSIYVEIQWTGWLLDGGVPLIIAYVAAIALAFITAVRVTLIRNSDLWLAGALLVAYNFGAFAACFVYPFFIGQGGMELWLLNAALFAAARTALEEKRTQVPLRGLTARHA